MALLQRVRVVMAGAVRSGYGMAGALESSIFCSAANATIRINTTATAMDGMTTKRLEKCGEIKVVSVFCFGAAKRK